MYTQARAALISPRPKPYVTAQKLDEHFEKEKLKFQVEKTEAWKCNDQVNTTEGYCFAFHKHLKFESSKQYDTAPMTQVVRANYLCSVLTVDAAGISDQDSARELASRLIRLSAWIDKGAPVTTDQVSAI